VCYSGSMKLSAYARQVGISYRTAWRWFKAGRLPGYQVETGTIIVTQAMPETIQVMPDAKVAVYARVSAAENKDHLEGQE